FVFARIDFEPAEIGECGIEQSQRMRKFEGFQHLDLIAFAVSDCRGIPLADTINSQNRGLLIWGRKECAGGMRFMMTGKGGPFLIAATERFADFSRQMQLRFE